MCIGDDEVLINASFINFGSQLEANVMQAECFIRRWVYAHKIICYACTCRYSSLLPFSSSCESRLLFEEFIQYHLLKNTDIPQAVWDQAKVYEGPDDTDQCHYKMDVI